MLKEEYIWFLQIWLTSCICNTNNAFSQQRLILQINELNDVSVWFHPKTVSTHFSQNLNIFLTEWSLIVFLRLHLIFCLLSQTLHILFIYNLQTKCFFRFTNLYSILFSIELQEKSLKIIFQYWFLLSICTVTYIFVE